MPNVEEQLQRVAKHAVAQSPVAQPNLGARRRSRRPLVLVAAAVTIVAVAGSVFVVSRDSEDRAVTADLTSTSRSSESRPTNAADALEAWQNAHIANYSFEYEQRCFCAPYHVIVFVEVGRATRVEPVGDGAKALSLAPTVESLLAQARMAENAPRVEHDIRYDPLGIPVAATIEPPVEDGWVRWSVRNFRTTGRIDPTDGFEAERRAWNALRIDDYSFVYTNQCGECGVYSAFVTVIDGEVSDVEPLTEYTPDDFDVPTIDDLYDELDRAFAKAQGDIESTIDVQTLVPTVAYIDWVKNAIDEESGWIVTGFRPGRVARPEGAAATRRRWKEAGIDNYSFEIVRTPSLLIYSARIVVCGGIVRSADPVDGGPATSVTLAALLDVVAREAAQRDEYRDQFAFNALGVPTRVSIDGELQPVDGADGWTIGDFVVLSSEACR